MTERNIVDLRPVAVGHDLLQLLTSAMYTDPMILYREYVQNSVDSIDAATATGLMLRRSGAIEIDIDVQSRIVRIRDNGTGISAEDFVPRLSSIGASIKRGSAFRGFRGIGRLVGLGYCRQLIFRSRSWAGGPILEGTWDCGRLRALLALPEQRSLADVVPEVFSVSEVDERPNSLPYPERFFEVELRHVVRLGDDRLVNPAAVAAFLSQVAPVPFSVDFSYSDSICAELRKHFEVPEVSIFLNGATRPLLRPYRDELTVARERATRFRDLEFIQVTAYDAGLAAVGWILHHDYVGALPSGLGVRGLRARHGNLQIGDEAILDAAFVEPRFNKWCVGELHVFDARLVPNGRRDAFEPSLHLDNLTGQLFPLTRRISKICRTLSAERNQSKGIERMGAGLEPVLSALDSRLGARVAPVLLQYVDAALFKAKPSNSPAIIQALRRKLKVASQRVVRLSKEEHGQLEAIKAMLEVGASTAAVLKVVKRLKGS